MLAQVTITATSGAVFNEQTLVVLLHDDVHHTRNGIGAIESRGGTFHNLYLLDIVWIDERELVLSTHIAMNALAVDQHEDIAIAKTIQLHLRTHIVFIEGKRCRET